MNGNFNSKLSSVYRFLMTRLKCILLKCQFVKLVADEPVVYVSHDSHKKDEYVTTIFAEDDDLDIDDDYIRWNITDDTKLIPWDYPNVTRTDRLFYIDGCKFGKIIIIIYTALHFVTSSGIAPSLSTIRDNKN